MTREDVIRLDDFWRLTALAGLKSHGLTASMLRNLQVQNFDNAHCYALQDLVLERSFSIQDALHTIEGLSSTQARRIRDGLTREAVLRNDNAPILNLLRSRWA